MSRTYNLPTAKVAGTFGQELPGIPADKMIPAGVRKRIVFMNENDDVRAMTRSSGKRDTNTPGGGTGGIQALCAGNEGPNRLTWEIVR